MAAFSEVFGALGNQLRDSGYEPARMLPRATPEIRVFEQRSGVLVINASLGVKSGLQTLASVETNDDVEIQITQGSGTVRRDPYTGLTLVEPTGEVPVKARAVLRGELNGVLTTLVGEEVQIGLDPSLLPPEQAVFDMAGGGNCRAMAVLGDQYEFSLRVRAVMPAGIIPIDYDRREIVWRDALYFAWDERIGLMRLRNNPAYRSKTELVSRTPKESLTAQNFFPASGRNELYFVLDMVDLGVSLINRDPMVQSFEYTEWPPYSTELTIDRPVAFYPTDGGDEPTLIVQQNDMRIYDYSSVDIRPLQWEVSEDGVLLSRWEVRSQAEEPVIGRWFAIGDFHQHNDFPVEGSLEFGTPAGTRDSSVIEFRARLRKSILDQQISMCYASVTGPVILGTHRVPYRFPTEP